MRFRKTQVLGGSLNCNAKSFIQDKKLKIVVNSKQMPHTEVSIIGKMMNLTQRFSRDRS
jgi:hypothetical protein